MPVQRSSTYDMLCRAVLLKNVSLNHCVYLSRLRVCNLHINEDEQHVDAFVVGISRRKN